jgi:hypothetical protein
MTAWDELKPVLARLRDQQPGVLASYPSLDSDLVVRAPPIRLGYTVPPGQWGSQATLRLGTDPRDAPRRRTPILPLTVTA